MNSFSVDTQLFRELGELLVGRDSTALIELVKNAYDADARSVTVYGENISTAGGFIRLTDDGVGMTDQEFRRGFLRIASRARSAGRRRSRRFGRHYTGEKGIGRLAAHKLASVLAVESVSDRTQQGTRESVHAVIDWNLVEAAETLDDVAGAAIEIETEKAATTARSGTTITLSGMRRRWTRGELGLFLSEVQDFAPPNALVNPLPRSLVPSPRLFDTPNLRDSSSRDPGFRVALEGDFDGGEEHWVTLLEAAHWLIEIDATGPRVRYRVSPTKRTLAELPTAKSQAVAIDHPDPDEGPFFQSRILVREGALRGPTYRATWARRIAGVRVFLEGFRLLPYGDRSNDWLSLDYDYALRQRELPRLRSLQLGAFEEDSDAPLVFLPNRAYFGAVFLTQKNAGSLRTLVNREGFVPESPYYHLVELVRTGVDLSVRVRAAAGYRRREERRRKRVGSQSPVAPTAPAQEVRIAVERVVSILTEARHESARGDVRAVTKHLSIALTEVTSMAELVDNMASEEVMLRVLASVGTQMAAFIHELNALLASAESLEEYAVELRSDTAAPRRLRAELSKIRSSLGDLRRGLERQAAYLIDIVTPDARRRRIRQRLAERFDAGFRLIEPTAERREIEVINNIPKDLKSPPMFPAELAALFSNLLSNAVKAAGNGGRIAARGSERNGETRVVVENTGKRVDPKKGERWFKPFESTTAKVDPVLGQGMGLGLPISRRILEEYGAEIRFVEPSRAFSTAVEIVFQQ